ncbi:MAG: hypothetical protein Q8O62_04395 [Aequorivita sp.]|nr:hypothetical protein [Aequorivita sp.]
MPEIVRIAELAIDNNKLLKSLSDTKKQIDELTKTQKELQKAGDTSSQTFVKNEAALKSLKSEYSTQTKVLQATTEATERLNTEIKREINSVDLASQNNKTLKEIRNQLNTTTVEGAQALEELNQKIDANNAYIKTNASALEKQKIEIGAYSDGIKDAANQLNPLNGGLTGFTQRAKDAGGTGNLLKSSLGGMAQGFVGITKASLAFIATPIGIVIAAIGAVIALVTNAMNRSEESTNKIKKAFSAFTGILQGVLKILEPVGEFLIDGIVKGLELAEQAVYKAIEGFANLASFLGFKEFAKDIKSFGNELEKSAANSKALADAEAKLTASQREAQRVQLEYQKDAEKLRQIRDNENLSIKERIAANDQLGKVLKEQLKSELEIAQQALIVANLRIQAEGKTNDALDSQAEALTRISDIQERLTGQESEQIANRVSLQKEGAEKAREIADRAIQKQQEQLELFIAQQGTRAKTLEEQLNIQKAVAEKEIKILDAQLKNRNISQEKYDAELLAIKYRLLDAQTAITIENAEREIEQYERDNQTKITSDQFYSDESLRIEQERLDGIAQKRRDFAALQLEEGVISQTQYNDVINQINEDNRIANEEAELERKEAQAEADLIDAENKAIIDEEKYLTEFELNQARLEQDRLAEIASAEDSGANIELINQKYDIKQKNLAKENVEYQKKIEQEKQDAKLSQAQAVFNGIGELLGKESAAGKAAAVAAAIINTFQGVTKALAEGGVIGIATGALVAATGAISISKILSTKPPKREKAERGMRIPDGGGLLQGPSHARGGIPLEAEGGEAIINRRSTQMYAPILSAINQAGGGVRFAQGGIVGSTSNAPRAIIDYDQIASKMAEANRSLPAPVVAVDEISRVTNRVSVIETNASF